MANTFYFMGQLWLIMMAAWRTALRSSWRQCVDLVGKAPVIIEQCCCHGCRSSDGVSVFAVSVTDRLQDAE